MSDNDTYYLRPRLIDILATMETEGKSLHWCISDLWVIDKIEGGEFAYELENAVKNSEFGLMLHWDDLLKLTQMCDSIITCFLLGFKDEEIARHYIRDGSSEEKFEIYIDINDNLCMEVKAKDKKVVKKINDSFGPPPFFVR